MPENIVRGGFAVALDAQQPGDDNRGWVQLMRTTGGKVVQNGRNKFALDEADLAAYAEYLKANPGRVPIDYDHSYATGGGTRAAGWIDATTVETRNEGSGPELWAMVDWTPAAADAIRAGEFRYFSPEFSFKTSKDGVLRKAKAFLAGALTNRPFFDDMAPVTLTDDQEDSAMADLATIAKSLGLAEDATPEVITAAVAAKDEELAAAQAAKDEAERKLQTRPDIADEQLKALIASAAKGEQAAKQLHDMQRDSLLDDAVRTGKILPVQKDGYAAMYDVDPENVTALIKATPERSFDAKGSGGSGQAGDTVTTMRSDGSDLPVADGDLHSKTVALLIADGKNPDTVTPDEYVLAMRRVEATA